MKSSVDNKFSPLEFFVSRDGRQYYCRTKNQVKEVKGPVEVSNFNSFNKYAIKIQYPEELVQFMIDEFKKIGIHFPLYN